MKATYKTIGILVVASFVVGIGVAELSGLWKTESTKEPVSIKEGEFAGMPNPSDIRGSYTWSDVAKAFGFDVNLALKAFGASDPLVKVNTLESIYEGASLPEGAEIGTDSVRLFVSLLTGLPHTPEESTILPFSAIEVLRAEGKASSDLIEEAAAKAYKAGAVREKETTESVAPAGEAPASAAVSSGAPTAPVTSAAAEPKAVQPAPSASPAADSAGTSTTTTVHTPSPTKTGTEGTGEGAAPGTITGKTTFKEIKAWGLSEAQIKTVTGGEIGNDIAAIRDWVVSKGLSFSEIKAKLQELLDAR
jgi:hypothetical protein